MPEEGLVMAIWLIRSGSAGQYEQKFLDEGRVYLCWDRLSGDLSSLESRDALRELLTEAYPNFKPGKIIQHSGQIWAFVKKMQQGDWVVMPSKFAPSIHIGKLTGEYHSNPSGPDPFYHWRPVEWFAQDIPRTNFDQDILYSFGAFLTICEIKRNDAERRIRAMAERDWRAGRSSGGFVTEQSQEQDGDSDIEDVVELFDLEQQSRDQISRHIIAKFKGHGLARLVRSLLEARGYTVHQPPEGPDRGIDLLASPGPLGFGEPRICVQVKSQESPLDRTTLDQLLGTMSNVQADRGLLVGWGGFKSSIRKEEAQQFFRVRLWDSDDLIDELISLYEKLDEDIRAEIPLKHMWTLAQTDDD